MLRYPLQRLALLLPVAGLAAAPATLSDPVGVYALVDRVVLEPDSANPRTIQIWGVFALADGRPGDNYLPARRGYLYYAINSSNERASRAEWRDLRTVAGTGQPIGFGGRYRALGRVRSPAEAASAPDTYPLGFGLVKVLAAHDGPRVEYELLRVPALLTPVDGGSARAGAVRLVTRNVPDPAVRYVFAIESGSERETSAPIAPGQNETAWTPRLHVRAGQTYTWQVHAVKADWRGQPATATFRGSR